LHWKLEPVADEEKVKVGVGSLVVPLGPPVIVVSGGVVSTVKLCEAGVGSVLPAGSVALTSKVWEPSVRALDEVWVLPGPEHAPNAPESKRHSKLDPASDEVKAKVGVVSLVGPEGPESTEVSGGVVSGENELTSDRVTSPPAGIVMGQLRPAPLS
jgi:hypothetical protein